MPYYQWRGVDMQAIIQKGALFAQSTEQLADLLLEKEIYLLEAHPQKYRFIFRRISHHDITSFFQNLAVLLEAKIHLADALPLVLEQSDNPRFQNILYAITDNVHKGMAFHKALESYPKFFPPFIVQLLEIGEESGTMSLSCQTIAQYMQKQSTLYAKIRSALLLPTLTFACFVVMIIIIFTALIPRFIDIFNSLKIPLTTSTQTLLYISSYITVPSVVGLFCCATFIALLFYKLSQSRRWNYIFVSFILHCPFIGGLMHYRFCTSFFQSLLMLLDNKISLDKAITFLKKSEKNSIFQREVENIQKAVHAGVALHTALSRSELNIFGNSTIAMIAIGEESGNLVVMLKRITDFYTKMIERRLYILTTLIQPLLMVVLGLCIALLITFLYVPLFNISLSLGN